MKRSFGTGFSRYDITKLTRFSPRIPQTRPRKTSDDRTVFFLQSDWLPDAQPIQCSKHWRFITRAGSVKHKLHNPCFNGHFQFDTVTILL